MFWGELFARNPTAFAALLFSIVCSFFFFFIIVGTALDLLFIQMPKWQTEKMLYTSTSMLHQNLDEHVPLLENPQAAVKQPEIGESLISAMCVCVHVCCNNSCLCFLFNRSLYQGVLSVLCVQERVQQACSNNNDGYVECLTCTGPKYYTVFKCTYFQNSMHAS